MNKMQKLQETYTREQWRTWDNDEERQEEDAFAVPFA
jgi:hypothetical protein